MQFLLQPTQPVFRLFPHQRYTLQAIKHQKIKRRGGTKPNQFSKMKKKESKLSQIEYIYSP